MCSTIGSRNRRCDAAVRRASDRYRAFPFGLGVRADRYRRGLVVFSTRLVPYCDGPLPGGVRRKRVIAGTYGDRLLRGLRVSADGCAVVCCRSGHPQPRHRADGEIASWNPAVRRVSVCVELCDVASSEGCGFVRLPLPQSFLHRLGCKQLVIVWVGWIIGSKDVARRHRHKIPRLQIQPRIAT